MANAADSGQFSGYATGVIFHQCSRLLSLCGEALVELGQTTYDPHLSKRILNDLVPLMRQYFRTDEARLREYGSSSRETHLLEHKALEIQMNELLWVACFELGEPFRVQFKQFVSSWLNHFRAEIGISDET